jgi:FAD/FMN-containing dehydrogenase
MITASDVCRSTRRPAPLPARESYNDTHSRLNATSMLGPIAPRNTSDVAKAVARIREHRQCLSAAGSRHAMGGQQFARDAWLIDMRSMNRVLDFDPDEVFQSDWYRHYRDIFRGDA